MNKLAYIHARVGTAVAVLLASVVMGSAQEPSRRPPWTDPVHPATAPQARRITVVEVYPYREMRYTPQFIFDPRVAGQRGAATAEESVMRRFRAMANADYAGWLATWDPVSRAEVEAENQKQGRTPESWTSQWTRVLGKARIALVRRIETGEYIIISYKILPGPATPSTVTTELHLALKKLGNEWFATNDLRRDGLMTLAPWLSGRDSLELVAK